MTSKLIAKIKINCATCGCSMQRTKTIRVIAQSKEQAIMEANEIIRMWHTSLAGQNCRVCKSILEAV